MGPEIGFGMGKAAVGRRKPSLFVRMLEIAGLVLVIFGLAEGPLWPAAVGIGMVLASYAIYRRKHGKGPAPGDGPHSPLGDDGGGD